MRKESFKNNRQFILKFFNRGQTILGLLLIIIIAFATCRKIDRQEEAVNKKGESGFFTKHLSNDPYVQSVMGYIKRRNSKEHFVENWIEKIGFAYWDKAIKTPNGGGTTARVSTDTSTTLFIPFVIDSVNVVKTTLVVNTTPSDTNLHFIADWQYKNRVFTTNDIDTSAEKVALLFMNLDKNVFGYNSFRLLDTSLFRGNTNSVNFTGRNLVFNSTNARVSNSSKVSTITTICVWSYFCGTTQICGPDCDFDNPPDYCPTDQCYSLPTVCYDFEINTDPYPPPPGGNNGGTGGGGSGGGTTPPECPPGPEAKVSTLPGCPPGWTPQPTINPQTVINNYLNQWDNDRIFIDTTVRPCTDSVLNSIKSIRSGAIARIIFALSSNLPWFDWEIKEDSLGGSLSNADAITNYDYINRRAYTILNRLKLANATNLSLARTIMHESIHAFLVDIYHHVDSIPVAVRDSILQQPLAKIVRDYVRRRTGSAYFTNQHDLMIKNFKDSIAASLKLLCPILGINLNPADLDELCSDMAWGGLLDPDDPPPSLADADIARILKRLDIELNNIPSFSGNVTLNQTGNNHYVSITRAGTKACP